ALPTPRHLRPAPSITRAVPRFLFPYNASRCRLPERSARRLTPSVEILRQHPPDILHAEPGRIVQMIRELAPQMKSGDEPGHLPAERFDRQPAGVVDRFQHVEHCLRDRVTAAGNASMVLGYVHVLNMRGRPAPSFR